MSSKNKPLHVWCGPIYFPVVVLCSWCHLSESIVKSKVTRIYPFVSSLSFEVLVLQFGLLVYFWACFYMWCEVMVSPSLWGPGERNSLHLGPALALMYHVMYVFTWHVSCVMSQAHGWRPFSGDLETLESVAQLGEIVHWDISLGALSCPRTLPLCPAYCELFNSLFSSSRQTGTSEIMSQNEQLFSEAAWFRHFVTVREKNDTFSPSLAKAGDNREETIVQGATQKQLERTGVSRLQGDRSKELGETIWDLFYIPWKSYMKRERQRRRGRGRGRSRRRESWRERIFTCRDLLSVQVLHRHITGIPYVKPLWPDGFGIQKCLQFRRRNIVHSLHVDYVTSPAGSREHLVINTLIFLQTNTQPGKEKPNFCTD